MAEAIVGPLVCKLQELALSEGRALVAVNGDIRRLRDKLMWLLAFLQEADPRRRARASELMRVLVHQTRDAAFSAEDAVDEYALRVDLSRYPGWSRAALGFLAGATTQLRVRHRLSGEIAAINTRLEEIVGNKDKYRLEDAAATQSVETWTASAVSSSESLYWDVLMPPIIGREEQQSELETMLLSPTPRLAVIYVVGESGVGRRMLVNSIYAKPTIRDHFEVSAVVKVQKNAGIPNILRLICDKLKEKNTQTDQNDQEQDHHDQPYTQEKPNVILKRSLTRRRYLVIVDGKLMAIADWNALIHALPKEETGSRVVLITSKVPPFLNHPNHDVREIKLKGLQYKDCKKLFHMRLHGREEAGRSYTRSYYRRVHNITGGLPLAVILLSGLMHNKEFPHEWDNVFKYLELAKSKRLDRILSLSFDDLHYELKLCFLYFTAFPEGYKAHRGTLVKLWVAEGFLAPRDGKTAEQRGHIYLRELIARGLVAEIANGDVSRRHLALHGSVYMFARSEAQEASFMEMHDGDHVPAPATVRRLTLQNSVDRYTAMDNTMPKLRSIIAIFQEERAATVNPDPAEDLSTGCFAAFATFCSGKQNRSLNISKFDLTKLLQGSKFLRVIMLERMDIGKELPEAIGSMVHLRYLGVRCRSLTTIHSSIGKLNNLQTMDVTNSSVRELPLPFWKITSLRHVIGHRLVMPKRASELKQLNTLSSVQTSQDWDGRILTRMVNLKILHVIINGALKEEKANEFSDNLNKLNYLTTLILEGDGLPMSIFTGPSLQWLKTMRLSGTLLPVLEKMPVLSDFQLPNLSHLLLSKMWLHEGFIERLGELPLLAELKLVEVSCDGEELVFQPDGFHSLRELAVSGTRKNVLIEELALPALHTLQIIGCSREFQHKIHPSHKVVKMIKEEDRNLFQDISTET